MTAAFVLWHRQVETDSGVWHAWQAFLPTHALCLGHALQTRQTPCSLWHEKNIFSLLFYYLPYLPSLPPPPSTSPPPFPPCFQLRRQAASSLSYHPHLCSLFLLPAHTHCAFPSCLIITCWHLLAPFDNAFQHATAPAL